MKHIKCLGDPRNCNLADKANWGCEREKPFGLNIWIVGSGCECGWSENGKGVKF